jgi:hypothetical protein
MFKHCWRYAVTSASTLAEQPVKAKFLKTLLLLFRSRRSLHAGSPSR